MTTARQALVEIAAGRLADKKQASAAAAVPTRNCRRFILLARVAIICVTSAIQHLARYARLCSHVLRERIRSHLALTATENMRDEKPFRLTMDSVAARRLDRRRKHPHSLTSITLAKVQVRNLGRKRHKSYLKPYTRNIHQEHHESRTLYATTEMGKAEKKLEPNLPELSKIPFGPATST